MTSRLQVLQLEEWSCYLLSWGKLQVDRLGNVYDVSLGVGILKQCPSGTAQCMVWRFNDPLALCKLFYSESLWAFISTWHFYMWPLKQYCHLAYPFFQQMVIVCSAMLSCKFLLITEHAFCFLYQIKTISKYEIKTYNSYLQLHREYFWPSGLG